MSEFDLYFNRSGINPRDREKHEEIWKNVVKKCRAKESRNKVQITEIEYGLDTSDKTTMAAIKYAEGVLSEFSEEKAIDIFNLELDDINDDKYYDNFDDEYYFDDANEY